MAIFKGLEFVVDFSAASLPFKEKKEIRRKIVEEGGTISYILTPKVGKLF